MLALDTSAMVDSAQTEISQLDMALVRKQHVVRFDVSVNNSMPESW